MKFNIITRQFGYAMFAAQVAGNAPQWSDQPHEAHTYDCRDNREMKLAYWRANAKMNGLDPAQVEVVECAS